MSELPNGWAWAAFSDVTYNHDGARVPVRASDRQVRQGQYPYYGASGIIDSVDEYLFDGEYLLIAEDGANLLSRSTPIAFQACGKFWVNNHAHVATATGATSLRYLEYYLNSIDLAPFVTGSAQPKLTQKALNSLPVPIAPYPEQERIVEHLDKLRARSSRARHELDCIPKLIERYKQAILAKAFSGELTAEWRNEQGLEPGKFVALGLVADEFSYGSSAKSAPEGRVPVLRMGNIQGGKLDWSDLVYTSDAAEIDKYKLQDGDVLFNRTNSPELVGKTALFTGDREAIYAGYLIRIRCCASLLPAYLTYYLNSPSGREYCWQVKTDGVSQSNVNATKLAAFEFLLPSVSEQQEIVRRIEHAFAWLEKIAVEHARAAHLIPKLDQVILAKAFRGELVPQDPDDEPASLLLERIKADREGGAQPRRRKVRA